MASERELDDAVDAEPPDRLQTHRGRGFAEGSGQIEVWAVAEPNLYPGDTYETLDGFL